jgi:hypothetical protein
MRFFIEEDSDFANIIKMAGRTWIDSATPNNTLNT